jgi:hypothetical protein
VDQVVGERHMQPSPGQRPTETALVSRRRVAVQETDRHRLRSTARHGCHGTPDGGRAERNLDSSIGEDAFVDSMPAGSRDERRRPKRFEHVELGAYLPADLEDVLEPLGGEEDDARAPPLEQRVGRHGRAVVESRPPGISEERTETAQHGGGRIARRRRDLQDAELAAHERHQVGEGTAGVDADEDWRGPQEPVFALEAAGFSLELPVAALVSDLVSDFVSDLLSVFDPEPPSVELSLPPPPPRP